MNGLISPRCSTYPMPKNASATGTSIHNGSSPASANAKTAAYIANVISSPWAKLTMRTTP